MSASIPEIIYEFGLDPLKYSAQTFGSGLIHRTYIVRENEIPSYILQQVNHLVFTKPEDISHNLHIMGNFMKMYGPDYPFTFPVSSTEGGDYVIRDGQYFRMFRFIPGTHTIDTCLYPEQAYEAAFQFGRFTAVLKDLRTDMLRYTIPGFHDLPFRYNEFLNATKKGSRERLQESKETAQWLSSQREIVEQYTNFTRENLLHRRVTHHDTKISNVLLDENNKGVCVIDLDTVMPGYFISDVGDMIRTYVSPANEEETSLGNIFIRKDFIEAIYSGYMENMGQLLTEHEKSCFVYAGKFMIYMQALRFYTDHLNEDRYYGAKYEGHNLNRARNQVRLFQELVKAEKDTIRIF